MIPVVKLNTHKKNVLCGDNLKATQTLGYLEQKDKKK